MTDEFREKILAMEIADCSGCEHSNGLCVPEYIESLAILCPKQADLITHLISQSCYLKTKNEQLPNQWKFGGNRYSSSYNEGYADAQQDMLKADFHQGVLITPDNRYILSKVNDASM